MTVAWIDASAGVAGDMLLGALLDAGADVERVRRAVAAIDEHLRVRVEATERHGIRATKVEIEVTHDQPAPHRDFGSIAALLAAADLDQTVRERAHRVFAALAEAEGRVHGVPPEQVHFHEVGALDAIGDVVGCAAALTQLGVTEVRCSPLSLGGGEQTLGEHGFIPIPGPAVLHLVGEAGAPVVGGPIPMELTTPTGAALVTAWADGFGPMPPMTVRGVGVGAGARDPRELANVCRVVLGEPCGAPAAEQPILLESNIDDLDPRLWPGVLAQLLQAGASDAWLTPILMKKGRPAHTLSVLCRESLRDEVVRLVLRETTTLGLREQPVAKHTAERGFAAVEVEGHRIAIKVATLDGVRVNAQPEFEDVARAADALGWPVKQTMARAMAAYLSENP